jgi:hypothetical protein
MALMKQASVSIADLSLFKRLLPIMQIISAAERAKPGISRKNCLCAGRAFFQERAAALLTVLFVVQAVGDALFTLGANTKVFFRLLHICLLYKERI